VMRALVLPAERAASTEPQAIPGMPGLWRPGVAYSVDALDLSEDETQRLLDAADSPLEWTEDEDALSSFTLEGLLVPSAGYVVEEANARDAVGRNPDGPPPAWVDQARDRATAVSEGRRVFSPHEANQIAALESRTKASLLSEAEDAGIPRAATMSKETLVARLTDLYFGGDETPTEPLEAAVVDDSVPDLPPPPVPPDDSEEEA
jgi:hypothetical protein